MQARRGAWLSAAAAAAATEFVPVRPPRTATMPRVLLHVRFRRWQGQREVRSVGLEARAVPGLRYQTVGLTLTIDCFPLRPSGRRHSNSSSSSSRGRRSQLESVTLKMPPPPAEVVALAVMAMR